MSTSFILPEDATGVKARRPERTSQYVLALTERQRRLGLSDAAFARKLGVSPGLWSWTRTGKWPVGMKLLVGSLEAFRDLWPEAHLFLTGELPISNSSCCQLSSCRRRMIHSCICRYCSGVC